MSKKYYLDSNFSSQTPAEIWQVATDFQLEYRSDTQSFYQRLNCEKKIAEAYRQIARAAGAEPQDYLHATASHGQNIISIFQAIYKNFLYPTGKNIILLSSFDVETEKALQSFTGLGCVIKKIAPNEKGQITVKEIEKSLSPKTAFLSLPFADPVTGIIYPIWEIGEYCRQAGIFFHVEISQVLGKMIFPFSTLPVDFLSFDGRLLYGLAGIAISIIKRDLPIAGIWREKKTVDAPSLLVALGFALQKITSLQEHLCLEIARYKSIIEKKLVSRMPTTQILFPKIEKLPNTSVIAFPGIHSEAMLYALQERGIYASLGNLYSSSLPAILSSCPTFAPLCNQSLHFSYGLDLLEEDIEEIVDRITQAATSLYIVSGVS